MPAVTIGPVLLELVVASVSVTLISSKEKELAVFLKSSRQPKVAPLGIVSTLTTPLTAVLSTMDTKPLKGGNVESKFARMALGAAVVVTVLLLIVVSEKPEAESSSIAASPDITVLLSIRKVFVSVEPLGTLILMPRDDGAEMVLFWMIAAELSELLSSMLALKPEASLSLITLFLMVNRLDVFAVVMIGATTLKALFSILIL